MTQTKTILAVGADPGMYPLYLAKSYAQQAGVQVRMEGSSCGEQDLEATINATPLPSLVVVAAYGSKTTKGMGAVEIIREKLGSDVPILVLGMSEETRTAAGALRANYAGILDFVEMDASIEEKIFKRYLK